MTWIRTELHSLRTPEQLLQSGLTEATSPEYQYCWAYGALTAQYDQVTRLLVQALDELDALNDKGDET